MELASISSTEASNCRRQEMHKCMLYGVHTATEGANSAASRLKQPPLQHSTLLYDSMHTVATQVPAATYLLATGLRKVKSIATTSQSPCNGTRTSRMASRTSTAWGFLAGFASARLPHRSAKARHGMRCLGAALRAMSPGVGDHGWCLPRLR